MGRKHPVFHHDGGRRLAGQVHLDSRSFNSREIVALVRQAFDYLRTAASTAG